jgi:hypothetical protein
MNAPKPSRRQILVGFGAISMEQSIRVAAPAEAEPSVIPPSEAGFSSDLEARLDKAVTESAFGIFMVS